MEAVARRCSVKKVFLEISQKSQENTYARVSFLIKLQASGLQLYQKRDSGTGIFCEFCEIFKSTFSYRTSPVAASEFNKIRDHVSNKTKREAIKEFLCSLSRTFIKYSFIWNELTFFKQLNIETKKPTKMKERSVCSKI